MTTVAAAAHAPTHLPLSLRPATPAEVYERDLDEASDAFQSAVAVATALPATRYYRAVREAGKRLRAQTAPTETEAAE